MSHSELISRDPCTDEIVWSGPAAAPARMSAYAGAAREGFTAWASLDLGARIAVARKFADLAKARQEDLGSLISRETGKPYWEALTEIASVAGKIEISIKAQAERAGTRETRRGDVTSAVRHRPHGVLGVIGPFNFPMHLPNGHIAPALLAGNAVLFKPSEKTPASGLALTALWHEAGVPRDVLQCLVGGAEIGQALVAADEVDGLLFTGSAQAGISISRALAGRPDKIVALELGGDNPLIAWDFEDVTSAAHLIAQSAFVSAGQRCTCARRLIVPDDTAGERLVSALEELAGRLRLGAPFDSPAPFLGPVIDNQTADHLSASFAALAEGGRIIRPLTRPRGDRPFLGPALVDLTQAARAPCEELFGPILQIFRVRSFDEAIAKANDTAYGLAAGLISDRRDLFDRFWLGARAGIVNWNRPTTGASSSAPFGGIGLSGNHRPSAYYAADYCAYPVAGLEAASPQFRITEGLSP